MLCKITMRAALAPVIGLFGVLAATAAGAQGPMNLTGTGENAPKALAYASESLYKADRVEIRKGVSFYKLKATAGELQLNATTDILLPGGERYYVRWEFGGGRGVGFTRALNTDDFSGTASTDPDTDAATVPTASAIAFGGHAGGDSVIIQLADGAYGRSTTLTVDLSVGNDTRHDDDENADTPLVFMDDDALLGVVGEGNIWASASVYSDLQDARNSRDSLFSTGNVKIIEVKRAVSAKVESLYDVAEVATPDAEGGPFRRFVESGMGGKNSGVLGKTTVSVNTMLRDARARHNGTITAAIVDHTDVVVTSDAGNFAVSLGDGGTLNKAAAGGNPWMLAGDDPDTTAVNEGTGCMNGKLTLGLANGDLDTYDADPDGPGADNPLAKGDLTPAGIRAATRASGTAGNDTGVNYFCVLVTGNKVAIPEIGDPMTKNSYELTVTPVFTADKEREVEGMAVTGKVGAIDRNGTTVHVSYLTTNAFVDQRLVIVNRGADPVAFWVEDFNLETGTTIPMGGNQLTLAEGLMVPAKGRMVVSVREHVTFEGQTRGSATVNVAAPPRDIDVMTIQRSPFTDEVDTTLY